MIMNARGSVDRRLSCNHHLVALLGTLHCQAASAHIIAQHGERGRQSGSDLVLRASRGREVRRGIRIDRLPTRMRRK